MGSTPIPFPPPKQGGLVPVRTPQEVLGGFLEKPAESSIIYAAWLGRTSTEDQQDPTLSLPRQLTSSERALAGLPQNVVLVAWYYDIETGRADIGQRGHSSGHERFTIPIRRDGGIIELLEETESPFCRFSVVICESIERIWRRVVHSTRVEHELAQRGITLLASDEPIDLSRRTAPRATAILTRRVKQGIAEWYVLEMLEKARGGFEEHTEAGFNIGRPPHGYLALRVPHPVPARRLQGRYKTRLVPDPEKAPAVQAAFAWRATERLGYRAIMERLNADLTLYPAPTTSDPARAVGVWTMSTVRAILHNPKYTGYQVWNRRAMKDRAHPGRHIHPSEWVWSSHPSHEPLVSLETFKAALDVAPHNARTRSDAVPGAINKHPQAKRTYRLRSYVTCTLCSKRMSGKTRKNITYYYCQPRPALHDHPPTIWLPERALMPAITDFFNIYVFGPDRTELLAASITTADIDTARTIEQKIHALQHALHDKEKRKSRLLRALEEDDDPHSELFHDIKQRLNALNTDRAQLAAQLSETEQAARTLKPTNGPELIQHLPRTTIDATNMPVELFRQLCDAFALRITYNPETNHADFHAEIASPHMHRISQLAEPTPTPRQPGPLPADRRTGTTLLKTETDRSERLPICDVSRQGHHARQRHATPVSGIPSTHRQLLRCADGVLPAIGAHT